MLSPVAKFYIISKLVVCLLFYAKSNSCFQFSVTWPVYVLSLLSIIATETLLFYSGPDSLSARLTCKEIVGIVPRRAAPPLTPLCASQVLPTY